MLKDRVVQARSKKHLTQEQLAADTGGRQCHISRIESENMKNVRGDVLAKIAQVLGVSTDYLLGFGEAHVEITQARMETLLARLIRTDDNGRDAWTGQRTNGESQASF
jgi:transcriptional regulator with XRE-family HTH domain